MVLLSVIAEELKRYVWFSVIANVCTEGCEMAADTHKTFRAGSWRKRSGKVGSSASAVRDSGYDHGHGEDYCRDGG